MKTIVFDFGNVIGFFDYRKPLERLREHTDLPEEQIRAVVIGSGLQDDYESGRITSEQFLQRVMNECRFRCHADLFAEAYSDIFTPNEEVCALLPCLKSRYRLLLGSNTCDLHAKQFKRQFADALRHFDALVLSHEVGTRKPDAGFFAACEKLAHCGADECLFIDDLAANVAGARACGWHGIVYRDSASLLREMRALNVAI